VKTLGDPPTQEEVVRRVDLLTPDRVARWGRLTCAQMVVHVTEAFGLYMGDLDAVPRRTPLQYAPLKHAFVYLLPIPRNVPTAPELLVRVPGDWSREVARLREAISSFAAQHERRDWAAAPDFRPALLPCIRRPRLQAHRPGRFSTLAHPWCCVTVQRPHGRPAWRSDWVTVICSPTSQSSPGSRASTPN
jgi:hypothetical protein